MPETLEDKLNRIFGGYEQIKTTFQATMPVGKRMPPSDFVIIGAVKRTLALADGFCGHIRARNFTCAGALSRLQLDTALRLYAATLFENPEEYAQAILDSKRVDNLRDRHKQRLTDSYLAKKLSELNPWVLPAYQELCDFVHLSRRHLDTCAGKVDSENRIVRYVIDAKDPILPDETYFPIVDNFYRLMRLSLKLAEAWQVSKAQGSG